MQCPAEPASAVLRGWDWRESASPARLQEPDSATWMPVCQSSDNCRCIGDALWLGWCGLKVHRALGPGLLESTYHACLAHELRCRDAKVGCEL
jgi:hypothetical protein